MRAVVNGVHYIGLDYTLSAYASEGGNFGVFTSHEAIRRPNYKIYAEAKRLGVKWILGGECGHIGLRRLTVA